ncbi:hypothetical protein T06_1629, partial [Trichinella sp. T6]
LIIYFKYCIVMLFEKAGIWKRSQGEIHDENGEQGQNQMTKSKDKVENLQTKSGMFNGQQLLASVVRICHEEIEK